MSVGMRVVLPRKSKPDCEDDQNTSVRDAARQQVALAEKEGTVQALHAALLASQRAGLPAGEISQTKRDLRMATLKEANQVRLENLQTQMAFTSPLHMSDGMKTMNFQSDPAKKMKTQSASAFMES